MTFNKVHVVLSLSSLLWLGTMENVVGKISIGDADRDINRELNRLQPKNGAEKSLNFLLGEIVMISDHGHGNSSRTKNATSTLRKQQDKEKKENKHTPKNYNNMNRKEQESDCILLEVVGNRIPNSNEICTCSHETKLDLTCPITDACSGATNNLCADSTSVHMDLNSGVVVEYCSTFSSDFTDTCVTLELNSDGDRIESCDAKYGDQMCDCNVCGDKSSIIVDCSHHNCRATTNVCQDIDLDAQELVTVVPDFQPNDWVCPILAPSAVNLVNLAPTPTMPPPSIPVSPENQQSEGKDGGGVSCAPKPQNEPRPPPEGLRDCFLYSLLATEMPDTSDRCICDGESTINCYLDNVCSDGVCADQLDLVVSIDNGNDAETCMDFSDDRFEETCVSVAANLDGTLMGCNYATYDGQECGCEICDDNMSISVDCSMYNEYATVTCQTMEGIEPQVLAFRAPPVDDDCNHSNSGGGLGGESLGDCGLQNLLEGRLGNSVDKCACDGDQRVDCKEEEYCYHSQVTQSSTCSESVDISIDVTQGVAVTNCIEFDDKLNGYDFDLTCVEVSVGIDFELEECQRVTYGGRDCACEVCDGGNGIKFDCTEYEENAWIPCQTFDIEDKLTPFVPHFGGSLDGSNEKLLRAGCSGATTMATTAVFTLTAMLSLFLSCCNAAI